MRYFEGRRLETRENMFVSPPDPTFMHALNPEKQRCSDINRPPSSTHIDDVFFAPHCFKYFGTVLAAMLLIGGTGDLKVGGAASAHLDSHGAKVRSPSRYT